MSAEVAAGKLRTDLDEKMAAAQEALDDAEARLRDEDHIRIDLPDPGVPASRRIAELPGARGPLVTCRSVSTGWMSGPAFSTPSVPWPRRSNRAWCAVIVVSHDEDFLGRLELTRTLSMRLPGVLVEEG